MKPDWDKLMKEFADHATIFVGDVDCTTAGKPLCDSNDVKGFPTIKTGDPSDLQTYEGGRDLSSLRKHAQGLKPSCSPANVDLCNDEEKAAIEAISALSDDELKDYIIAGDKKSADAEKLFSSEVEKLQATYQQLQKDKDATVAEIKESGLGLHKAVQANRKKTASAKEEL